MLEQIRWALSEYFSSFLQGLVDNFKHPRILYFQPGEIAFHVRHDNPLTANDVKSLISDLIKYVSSKTSGSKIGDEITKALGLAEVQLQGQINTSPTLTLEPSFHIPAALAHSGKAEYMTTLYVKTSLNNDQLMDVVVPLNDEILKDTNKNAITLNGNPALKQNFVLHCVSLNWHAGSAQGLGSGGGGPGAIPVSVTQPQAKAMLDLESVVEIASIGRIQAFAQDVKQAAKDEPLEAEIVILDTVPPLPQLAAQFQKFVINRNGDEHPVLHSFFGKSSGFDASLNGDYLTVTPQAAPGDKNITFRFSYNMMRNDDGRLLMDVLSDHDDGIGLNNFPHKITDHGLFVAGSILQYLKKFNDLISDDAKKMKFHIHLVQTLSDYGVGTFESLQHSLNFALNNRVSLDSDSRAVQKGLPVPLVINCSLMLVAPRYGQPFKLVSPLLDHEVKQLVREIAPLSDKQVTELYEQEEFDSKLIQIMLRPFDYIISRLDTKQADGVNIIAAAGNENIQNELRSPNPDTVARNARIITRFPAAFKNVTGVGALKWDWKTYADYSNRADEPQAEGAAAPGGEAFINTALKTKALMTIKDKGVVGVYLGDFPRLKWRGKKSATRQENQSGWASWSGTSFATPRITALVAMLRAQGSTAEQAVDQVKLTPEQIDDLDPTGQRTPVYDAYTD